MIKKTYNFYYINRIIIKSKTLLIYEGNINKFKLETNL